MDKSTHPEVAEVKSRTARRISYAAAFVILLAIEVLIALYVHDSFIRPYGGDILVTILLCCFARIFFVSGCRPLPLWVFLFSAAVEIAQLFDPAELLGLGNIPFFRILIGSTFSLADLLCYASGCVIFFLIENILSSYIAPIPLTADPENSKPPAEPESQINPKGAN